jgi:hypothetical protein
VARNYLFITIFLIGPILCAKISSEYKALKRNQSNLLTVEMHHDLLRGCVDPDDMDLVAGRLRRPLAGHAAHDGHMGLVEGDEVFRVKRARLGAVLQPRLGDLASG